MPTADDPPPPHCKYPAHTRPRIVHSGSAPSTKAHDAPIQGTKNTAVLTVLSLTTRLPNYLCLFLFAIDVTSVSSLLTFVFALPGLAVGTLQDASTVATMRRAVREGMATSRKYSLFKS